MAIFGSLLNPEGFYTGVGEWNNLNKLSKWWLRIIRQDGLRNINAEAEKLIIKKIKLLDIC